MCFVYVWGLSWIFFTLVDRVIGMRTTPEVELGGLDIPEMGAWGYPVDFPGTGPTFPVIPLSVNGAAAEPAGRTATVAG